MTADVLAILEDGRDLLFGGSLDPAAYLELKSLGPPEVRTADYSRARCELLGAALGIPAERV